MRGLIALITGIVLTTASPASAEVVARSNDGFTLRFSVGVEASPDQVLAAVSKLPQWWDPAHTYTGQASNLSLAFQPGGCWCEALADGTTFQHGQVRSITTDQVVMNAPLGPLHGRAARADLTFGTERRIWGSQVTVEFVVEGQGLGAMTDGVNGVMDQAFDRLIHQIEFGEQPQP